ncbi:MAG: hypothetical protein IT437_03770, partial [Phycisphaerales bacterium]|nr:hypothetical protein [Phycisphaerales bacterium]
MTTHALRALGVACGAALIAAAPAPAQTCEPYWTLAGSRIVTYSMLTFDDGSGPAVYNAGYLWPEPMGNRREAPVRRWRGGAWEDLIAGAPPTVAGSTQRIRVLDDGGGPKLYLTGSAPWLPPYSRFVRRWNGQAWEPANPLLYSDAPGGGIAMISFDDGAGAAIYGIAGSNGNRIVRWNGIAWVTVGSVPGGSPLGQFETFDDGTGSALYITGHIFSVNGLQTRDIIRWNGQQWSAVGGGIVIRTPRDMCVYDGSLYVSDMTAGGGKPINGLGRWDGAAWSNAGAGFTSKGFLELYSMEVFDDGTGPALFVAGLFEDAGGVPTRNLA